MAPRGSSFVTYENGEMSTGFAANPNGAFAIYPVAGLRGAKTFGSTYGAWRVAVFPFESRRSIVTEYNPGSGTVKLPVLKTPGALSHRANPYATRCASRSWGVRPGWIRNATGSPGIRRKSTNIKTSTTMIVTTVRAARLIRNDRSPTASPFAYHRPSRL